MLAQNLDAMAKTKTTPVASNFLGDPLSQILLLKDALATGSGPALLRALNEIVRTLGLAKLCEHVGVDKATVDRALLSPDRQDFSDLQHLAETIVEGWGNLPDARGHGQT